MDRNRLNDKAGDDYNKFLEEEVVRLPEEYVFFNLENKKDKS